MKRLSLPGWALAALLAAGFSLLPPQRCAAQEPVVYAVLFYSPSCPHCHEVIQKTLPPLMEQYGQQLQIIGVNVTTPEGQALYNAAIEKYAIPRERRGVPTLIIGDRVLVGSGEIPEFFPSLIAYHLENGGVDLPDIPGLADALQTPEAATPAPDAGGAPAATASPAAIASPALATPVPLPTAIAEAERPALAGSEPSGGVLERLARDPAGNTLSILMLGIMLAAVAASIAPLRRLWQAPAAVPAPGWREAGIAALSLIGLGVSAYMAYVETTLTEAICGPVGDCNSVQQSAYARLFGLIPIGVLGVAGYAALLAAWAAARLSREPLRGAARLALAGMALGGTLFSLYLTFLEPFVIGATCAWCLTSAAAITLILLLASGASPGRSAASKEQRQGSPVSEPENP